jgi:hypothetical protein
MAKKYLVIGTAERGYDYSILRVLGSFASEMQAQTVYAGETASRTAREMYDRLSRRVREVEGGEERKRSKRQAVLHRELTKEVNAIIQRQDKLVEDVEKYLPDVLWVTNHELSIPMGLLAERETVSHLDVSKYLTISPVSPNGSKVTGMPITDRSVTNYAYFNNSCIAPHPVFATETMAKSGFNEGFQYQTTGALRWPHHALRASEAHEHCSHPGAILVTICEDTGIFYSSRIAVDKGSNGQLFILYDGLVYTAGTVGDADAFHPLSADMHYPNEHGPVVMARQLLGSLVKHRIAYDLGDLGDFPSLSMHCGPEALEVDGKFLVDDLQAMTRGIEALTQEGNALVTLESNHHHRVTRYVNSHKVLKGVVGLDILEEALRGQGVEVTIREHTSGLKPLKVGDITLLHGDHTGSLLKLSKVYGKAIVGHNHTYREYRDAIWMGAGCTQMAYLKGDADRWRRQIGNLSVYRGTTRAHVKTVLEKDGWTSFEFRGQIYKLKA